MPAAIAIEVGMQREVPAAKRERWACASKMRIGDEAGDSGKRGEKVEKRHSAKLGQEMANRRIDLFEACSLKLPEARRLLPVIAAHPSLMIGAGKCRSQIARKGSAQEFVERVMGIWRSCAVRITMRKSERSQRFAIEKKTGR